MIKAIVFDLGGVFCTNAPRHIIREIALKHDVDVMDVLKSWNKHWHPFICGKISEDAFYESIIRELHILGDRRPTIDAIKLHAREFIAIMPANFQHIKTLKEKLGGKVKFALLSNNAKEWYEYITNDHDLSVFDVIINSFEKGTNKPNEGIYQALIDELDVKANEILFTDDKTSNVEGAVRAGINAVQFTNFSALLNDLRAYKTIDDRNFKALSEVFKQEEIEIEGEPSETKEPVTEENEAEQNREDKTK